MSNVWQVQDAKARFSELLETSLAEGPQIVTKRGVEAAVLVPIDQWRRLEQMTRPGLKELLLAPEARTDALTPPREKHRVRASLSPARHQYRFRIAPSQASSGCLELDRGCGRRPAFSFRGDRGRDPGRYRDHPRAGFHQGGRTGNLARQGSRFLQPIASGRDYLSSVGSAQAPAVGHLDGRRHDRGYSRGSQTDCRNSQR